jgi:hypothetical protein
MNRPSRAAAALAALAALVGCTAAWNERYVHRIGRLAGMRKVLDRYERSLARRSVDDLLAVFDTHPTAQRAGAEAIADLRAKLAPLLAAPRDAPAMIESEVRDFDLFSEPPSARFWFSIGGTDASGARHRFLLSSFTTFRELSRAPRDREGLEVAELAILSQDPYSVEHQVGTRMHFEDATAKAGLSDRHRNQVIDRKCLILQGTMPGSGAAAADFDGDGDLDLAALDGQSSRLYLNRGSGVFDERSREWGLDSVTGAGAVTADYDNDGDPDLYVLDHFGGTRLLRNDGEGGARRFQDVTAAAGVGVADPTFSAAFADVDRDGDLDLYVPVPGDYYEQIPMPPFMARDGRPNRLFLNDGQGRFTEEAAARGVDDVGWGLCCAFCDYDQDGDPDLYVANDFGTNNLYRNDGSGHFEDVAVESGAADRGYGMGVSWGDVDQDGDFDLYVSDIWSEYAPVFLDPDHPLPPIGRLFRGWVSRELHRMGLGNALLLHQGDGSFVDVGKDWRVNECGWAWAGMFLDFDNDADLDLYCPDGSYTGASPEELELTFWAMSSLRWEKSRMQQWLFDAQGRSLQGHERNRLFEQLEPGRFAEVGWLRGVDAVETGRGFVLGDFDDDGWIDFYLRNLNDEARYFRNLGGSSHWLRLELRGTASNRDAVGAVVRARAGGRTQMRQVTAGEGFYSSHDKRLLFGLAGETAADVEVRWPSGLVEPLGTLRADRAYRVVEGSGRAEPLAPPASGATGAP